MDMITTPFTSNVTFYCDLTQDYHPRLFRHACGTAFRRPYSLVVCSLILVTEPLRHNFCHEMYLSMQSLDAKWVKEAERGLIAPDCVFYLELDPTKAATRADYGNEIYEKHDVQQKVYEAFKVFSGESYWKPINAGRDIETVHSDIWESFQNVKNNLCDAPEAKIPRLWGDNL
eukprot:GHVT01047747.1.p1 GENE.GHVT01047747.1~~GHVT01047747.1.p1  ORF type:complete len:173 (-),score=1.81 GHVT01047747.1:2063-2581(-)